MENNENLATIIWRKLANILLDFPEFVFLLKIFGGLILLGIAYLIIKGFMPR
jgi:hypothetical protein